MKKFTGEKKSFKRQLISCGIYVALSAVVVAVSVNTAISLMPDTSPIESFEKQLEKIDTSLPEVPLPIESPGFDAVTLPDLYDYTSDTQNSQEHVSVSDTADGVSSLIIENKPSLSEQNEISSEAEPSPADTVKDLPLSYLSIPEDADLGFDGYIKPFDGYVSTSHSVDVPVYSPTMLDYRTHIGVDIAGDIGESVKAVSGGIITEIYTDDLYGNTVVLENGDGYVFRYCNLMPTLASEIEVGNVISTGTVIGGIGESAIVEAAESSHRHLEIYDKDNNPIDPETFIEF